jgi:hypothetical protein
MERGCYFLRTPPLPPEELREPPEELREPPEEPREAEPELPREDEPRETLLDRPDEDEPTRARLPLDVDPLERLEEGRAYEPPPEDGRDVGPLNVRALARPLSP